jgi:hypothetical protein
VIDCWGYTLDAVIKWLLECGFEPLLIDDARELLKERGFG